MISVTTTLTRSRRCAAGSRCQTFDVAFLHFCYISPFTLLLYFQPMKYLRKPFFTEGSIALLPCILWSFFGHMSVFAGDKGAKAADAEECVSATVIVDGCEVSGIFREKSGTIKKVGGNLVLERWGSLRAVIKMSNPHSKGRTLTFFYQVISQKSKSPSDYFRFKEGTLDMAILPGETIVRDFPFINIMASMPSDYMKDTIQIRISKKRFEKWDEQIAIEPTEKPELGDLPVTIAQRTKQPAGKKTTSNVTSSEQDGVDKPATAVDSKAEGSKESKPESKARSRSGARDPGH